MAAVAVKVYGKKRAAASSNGVRKKQPLREKQEVVQIREENENHQCLQEGCFDNGKIPSTKTPNIRWDLKGFEIEEHLGKGGFASVYKVRDKEDGRRYALKHQKIEADSTEEDILFESEIISKLSHRNIVRCFGSFRTSLTMNLVLELCEEGNLYEVMTKTDEKLTPDRARQYTAHILEALVYLHTKIRIIHMDLKPENVLVTNGVAKVSDFGCAVKTSGLRTVHKEHNGGTLSYRPPEMLYRHGFDSTVDVWALGCIAYEMQFRRHPFFTELWKSGFCMTEQAREDALKRMKDAQKNGLFSTKPKCQAALRAFLDVILSSPRQQRPLVTELEANPWLRGKQKALAGRNGKQSF